MERYEVRSLRELITQLFNESTDEDFKKRFSVRVGNARYDNCSTTFKLVIVDKDATGGVEDEHALAFKSRGFQYGFEPDDLGKRFFYKGEFYEITGLKTRTGRTPIIVKRVITGQKYRMAEDIVLACLKARKGVTKG